MSKKRGYKPHVIQHNALHRPIYCISNPEYSTETVSIWVKAASSDFWPCGVFTPIEMFVNRQVVVLIDRWLSHKLVDIDVVLLILLRQLP